MNMKILAFAGSLREKSYNKSTLRAAQELAPTGMEIEIFDLINIPLYNADVEDQGTPRPVLDFRDKIQQADGLIIATPEYSNFMSGVLKNALDWASRTVAEQDILTGKPLAIMGASPGGFGTARAQLGLQALAAVLGLHLYVGRSRVLVSNANEKFNANGELIDETTKKSINQMLEGYREWILRLRSR